MTVFVNCLLETTLQHYTDGSLVGCWAHPLSCHMPGKSLTMISNNLIFTCLKSLQTLQQGQTSSSNEFCQACMMKTGTALPAMVLAIHACSTCCSAQVDLVVCEHSSIVHAAALADWELLWFGQTCLKNGALSPAHTFNSTGETTSLHDFIERGQCQ